jgi:hypothetical protein
VTFSASGRTSGGALSSTDAIEPSSRSAAGRCAPVSKLPAATGTKPSAATSFQPSPTRWYTAVPWAFSRSPFRLPPVVMPVRPFGPVPSALTRPPAPAASQLPKS